MIDLWLRLGKIKIEIPRNFYKEHFYGNTILALCENTFKQFSIIYKNKCMEKWYEMCKNIFFIFNFFLKEYTQAVENFNTVCFYV